MRQGTAFLLAAFEPGTGQRLVEVSARRTGAAYCRFMQGSAAAYPQAEKTVLVQDNLNTHTDAVFYQHLTAVAAPAPLIADGDLLRTSTSPAIDEMLKTLSVSNKNLVDITEDLRQITGKLNGSRALWELLGDQQVAANVRQRLRHAASAATTLQAFL